MGLHVRGQCSAKDCPSPAPSHSPKEGVHQQRHSSPQVSPHFYPVLQVPEKMVCGPGSWVKDCDVFPRGVTVSLVPWNTHPSTAGEEPDGDPLEAGSVAHVP